jgi:hypothetical protein
MRCQRDSVTIFTLALNPSHIWGFGVQNRSLYTISESRGIRDLLLRRIEIAVPAEASCRMQTVTRLASYSPSSFSRVIGRSFDCDRSCRFSFATRVSICPSISARSATSSFSHSAARRAPALVSQTPWYACFNSSPSAVSLGAYFAPLPSASHATRRGFGKARHRSCSRVELSWFPFSMSAIVE